MNDEHATPCSPAVREEFGRGYLHLEQVATGDHAHNDADVVADQNVEDHLVMMSDERCPVS